MGQSSGADLSSWLFSQSKGHLCEGIRSSLAVIINIQNDPHWPYQTFIDHSVDQDLKGVQGATMPSDENPFLITLDLKMEASFFYESFYLCFSPYPF